MLRFNDYLIEQKNTHMTHVEELIFMKGVEGTRQAIEFLRDVRDALVSERGIRESEMDGPGDERGGRRGGGVIRRRRRRGGSRRRRRDFTRRFSRAEGGRRGRSGKEMAAFRD